MILTRCIRRFETDAGCVELVRDAEFATAPPIGARLRFPDGPLDVVAVELTPRPEGLGVFPPSVVVYLRPEPAAVMASARAAGWQERPAR